ncbi:MAG: SpoIIE family protein phosphatase [Acidobacteria bacterium]|nr:SpoIIE family protein phosphatase [Acidobacteriota bacterium]
MVFNRDTKRELLTLRSQVAMLRKSLDELSILNDIATAISSTLSLDDVLDLITRKCVQHIGVEQAAVFLVDRTGENDALKTRVRHSRTTQKFVRFRLDDQLTGWMLTHRKPMLLNNISDETAFLSSTLQKHNISNLLAIPLIVRGEITGLIALFNKKNARKFNENDQSLLSVIASESAQLIESSRLREEELKLIHLQEELKTSERIQRSLLPASVPEIHRYDISVNIASAKEIGGDYYDFIQTGEKTWVLCVGDISGKGLPAALLMANLQATVRGESLYGHPDIRTRIADINRRFFNNTTPEKYATLFYGMLDAENHTFEFVNAGHNKGLLLAPGQAPALLSTGNLAVGFFEDAEYTKKTVPMAPGSILAIYSDGITEALNEQGEEFGMNRLIQQLNSHCSASAENLTDSVFSAVRSFAGTAPQYDDMTIMIVRRRA